jgi:hypothetical protein
MTHDQKRFRVYLQITATIVAILAAVVPGVIWTVDRLTNKPTSTVGPQNPAGPDGASAQTPTFGAAVTPPPTNAGKRVFLDSLTPDTGTTNLSSLPRALTDQPGYEHAVTVPCGSNNSGDRSRVVTYLLERRYVSLSADVRSFQEKVDEYKVEMRFYADNQQPRTVQIGVNEHQPFTMSVDGVKKLTLELTCERPGAFVSLTNAWLERP